MRGVFQQPARAFVRNDRPYESRRAAFGSIGGWLAEETQMNDNQQLRSLLSNLYEKSAGEIRLSPSWLATEAMNKLDGEKHSPTLGRGPNR